MAVEIAVRCREVQIPYLYFFLSKANNFEWGVGSEFKLQKTMKNWLELQLHQVSHPQVIFPLKQQKMFLRDPAELFPITSNGLQWTPGFEISCFPSMLQTKPKINLLNICKYVNTVHKTKSWVS